MASIIKVDQIQTAAGGTPTAADLGINVGGNVLQVVQALKTDTFTSTAIMPTFADITGLSASITPTSTSSKILVICNGGYGVSSPNYGAAIRLVRGSTPIAIGDQRGSETRASAATPVPGVGWMQMFNVTYLDSPNTTAATTYKAQLSVESAITSIIGGSWNSGAAYNASVPSMLILMEIAG
jgi:hypothetical protein